jgi:hypothetical protein
VLTFDEATHTYRWEGKVVPSVTQHLQALHSFDGVPRAVLEAAQERGTYVHQMCELFDLDELDEPAVPAIYQGYLRAWKLFVADYEPNWAGIEAMEFSKRHLYAGTMDRHGVLARRAPGRWVVDIKTSQQAHRVWGLQTAAYRQLLMERDFSHAKDLRATVQLRPDGTYAFLPWTDPADWPTFQALTTITNWIRK